MSALLWIALGREKEGQRARSACFGRRTEKRSPNQGLFARVANPANVVFDKVLQHIRRWRLCSVELNIASVPIAMIEIGAGGYQPLHAGQTVATLASDLERRDSVSPGRINLRAQSKKKVDCFQIPIRDRHKKGPRIGPILILDVAACFELHGQQPDHLRRVLLGGGGPMKRCRAKVVSSIAVDAFVFE